MHLSPTDRRTTTTALMHDAARGLRAGRMGVLLSLALLSACATHSPAETSATTFVVVRHAEKAGDDPRDPTLSEAGLQRAQRLADLLSAEDLQAAYATAYRRTQLTAQPAAARHSVSVTTYDANQAAGAFASVLRAAHGRGTVLVTGHSNTVPGITAALCGCTVAPIGEDDFGNVYRVRIDDRGRATLDHQRY